MFRKLCRTNTSVVQSLHPNKIILEIRKRVMTEISFFRARNPSILVKEIELSRKPMDIIAHIPSEVLRSA